MVSATFGVTNYTFTGAPNPLDMTGGKRIVAFASKIADHRGLTLTSAVTAELDKEDLELGRTGTGVSMKIPAKDCASGGIFQMEPERADGTPRGSRTRSARTSSTSTTRTSAPARATSCRSRTPPPRSPRGSTSAPTCRRSSSAATAPRSPPALRRAA